MHAPTGGLYKDAYERDSCGFGLIASLDDQPSHWLVRTAITSLNRLTHRGAIAEDGKTGDGCGLLLKKPEAFLRALAAEGGIELAARFASGLVFLHREPQQRGGRARARSRRSWRAQGLERRRLAHGADRSGRLRRRGAEDAAAHRAAVRQLPAARPRRGGLQPPAVRGAPPSPRRRSSADPVFYVPSLSASTIVFKGMVMPQYLAQFYPDLADPRLEASVAVFHQRFSTNTLPQWRLAHPYRYLAHNGEINTIQGNRNWAIGARPAAALAAAAGAAGDAAAGLARAARTRRASTTCSRCC